VNIHPAMYNREKFDSLPPLCTFPRAEAWLEGTGLDPDLVLCNDVNVVADTSGVEGMIVSSTLQRAYHGRLESMGSIHAEGLRGDVRYLALRTATEIVRTLQQEERFRMKADDEAVVADRILVQFKVFMDLQGSSGTAAAGEVDRFRSAQPGDERLTVEDVLEVLDTLGPKVNLDRFEEGSRRTREALLQRFGGGE